jgi:hypothetical protein
MVLVFSAYLITKQLPTEYFQDWTIKTEHWTLN